MDEYIGWHFLESPERLGFGDKRMPKRGETMRDPDLSESEGKLALCRGGFHACKKARDALSYAPGAWVAKVRLSGQILQDTDKVCATERTPLTDYVDVTNVLHEFACACAEDALRVTKVKDKRCWKAIETKRAWLRGEATNEELDAARDAAWDAAWDAARDAAWAAARAAARAAAWDAARAAAWDAQDDKLTKMLEEAIANAG